jgi:small subunit ribosomal protein S20
MWAITLMLRMALGGVIASTLFFRPAYPHFRLQSAAVRRVGVIPRMANIKSQKKRILTNAKRQERNKAVRSELKTRVKNADRAAVEGAEDIDDQVRRAVKALDMAAAKGIIHKNQAANRKSKLMKRVAKAQAT